MGKWVPRLDTRGAYSIFHIKFDSDLKYFKNNTSCSAKASEHNILRSMFIETDITVVFVTARGDYILNMG